MSDLCCLLPCQPAPLHRLRGQVAVLKGRSARLYKCSQQAARPATVQAARNGCRLARLQTLAAGRLGPLGSCTDEDDIDFEYEDVNEKAKNYRRTVFTFERWAAHRSTRRYLRHMKGVLASRIVRGLLKPLIYVMTISVMLGLYETTLQAGYLPSSFASLAINTTEPFNLTSFALSLLLVFRTDASYSRWQEARKVWEMVINRTRDLVRQGLTWLPRGGSGERDVFVRWCVAFPYTLKAQLREEQQLGKDLQDILLPHEVSAVVEANNPSLYTLRVLSELLSTSHLTETQKLRIDESLTMFGDTLGDCKRLLKTPIPLSYTRHTSRFLVIWLTFLPFTLWQTCGWATAPMSGIIAFLLLGIEEIGVQIEEPFGILPLESLCELVTGEVQAMLDEDEGVRKVLTRSLDATQPGGGLSASIPPSNGMPPPAAMPPTITTTLWVGAPPPVMGTGHNVKQMERATYVHRITGL